MNLSRLLPLLFLLSLLAACRDGEGKVRIYGQIKGIEEAMIMVYEAESDSSDLAGIDTIFIKSGKFDYERSISSAGLLTLVYPNFTTTTLVAEPGQSIHLKGEAHALKQIEVTGSDDNKLLAEFRQRVLHKSTNDAQLEAASFVRSNPTTLAAVAVYREYFDQVEHRLYQPAFDLLQLLVKNQKNALVAALNRRLRPQVLTAEGATFPDFTATTLGGKTIRRADLIGKPTLLVFSASWDGHTYGTLQTIADIRIALSEKVNIYRLSFEASRTDAQRLADPDSLRQLIVPEGGLQSSLAKTLGVRFVPGCLLLDAQGKVVARDLPTDAWLERLQRLAR